MSRQPDSVRPGEGSSAAIFAALGDETRLGLVARLSASGPMSIARLTHGTNVSRQAVTKHLQVLEGAGLARSRRQGRESVWELELKRILEAREFLDAMSARWDSALERLRAFVEDPAQDESESQE